MGSRGRREDIENQIGVPAHDEEGAALFLGLASYYRRFMPGFVSMSKPLNPKTSEKVTFAWTKEMRKFFDA